MRLFFSSLIVAVFISAFGHASAETRLSYEPTWTLADEPDDLFTGGKGSSLGSLFPELASITDQQQTAPAAQPAVEVTQLAGTPAAAILILQGLLFIGLVKSRRKWAMVAVAALTMGRAGLHALPKILSTETPKTASATEYHQLRDTQRFAADAHAPGLRFISLLKGLDTEPAHPKRPESTVATISTAGKHGTLSVVSPALSCLYIPDCISAAPLEPSEVLCSRNVPATVSGFSPTLYARPPPEEIEEQVC